MLSGPIVAIHISNIHQRAGHYDHFYASKIATAVIAGLGPDGYIVATRAIVEMIQRIPQNEDG
jgi:3-dehydroquinate dehydratase-2